MRFCYRTPLFPEPEGPLTEEIELTGTSGMVKEETENFFSDLFIQQEEQQDGKVGWVAVGEFEAASVCSPQQQQDGRVQEPGQPAG